MIQITPQLTSLILAECRRMAALWWSYRISSISSLLLHAIIFPILMITFQNLATQYGTAYGSAKQLESLVGFLVWYLGMKVFAAMPRMLEEEAGTGTLENLFITPLSPLTIITLRTAVLCLRYGLETAVLGVVLSVFLKLSLTFSFAGLLVLLLTLLGVCGVGLAVAGLALAYKSVSSVVGVISFLALLASGALVPLDSLGTVFQTLKVAFPLTWGIDLLRDLQGSAVVGDDFIFSLMGLALQTAVFLLLGTLLFWWGNGLSRRAGALNHS